MSFVEVYVIIPIQIIQESLLKNMKVTKRKAIFR